MKKAFKSLMMCSLIMLFLSACGTEAAIEKNTLSIDKKNVVTETLIDDFSKEYYSSDELKQMIDNEVSDYNSSAGADNITVENFEVADKKVKLVRKYTSYKDYAGLTGQDFFVGTVAEAYDKGYSFTDMTDADGEESISKSQVLEMSDYKIVICSDVVDVRVNGKIAYVSSGVKVKDSKTASVEKTDELSFILYQ